ncbi:tetratricopeptide repeat protein [Sinomicrobium sp. M5D2P9]
MHNKIIIFFIFFQVVCWAQEKNTFEQRESNLAFAQNRADTYLQLLQEHYYKGAYELHKKYSDSLLQVAQQYNLREMEVRAIVNQAIYYNRIDAFEKALTYYNRALDKCELISDNHITKTRILVNIGNTYNRIGAYQKAIDIMDSILIRSRSQEVPELIKIAAYNGLALSYSHLKDEQKSLDYLLQVKTMGMAINDDNVVATALNNIGSSYVKLKEYDKAIEAGVASLAWIEGEGPTKRKAMSLFNMGVAYLRTGAREKAVTHFKEAKKIAGAQGYIQIEMDCYLYLAEVYEMQGHHEASYKAQKRYSEMLEINMKEISNASTLDLKNETTVQREIIGKKDKQLTFLQGQKKGILFTGSAVLIALTGLLFFYIRKRKQTERERLDLLKNYVAIQDQHKALKIRMQDMAEKVEQKHLDEKITNPKPQYKNSSLTEANRKKYMARILEYMEKEKPFLDPDINHPQLASKLGMSNNHLSEVLTLCFEQNFYNFMNIYRVNEAQKHIKSSRFNNSKILAIAYESGFKSKTTFNRVFKNHTGLTPSEYRQKQ